MKRFAVIGTASLFLLFGTSAAFAAQEHPESDKPEKQESKPEAKPEAKPAAKPAAKQEPQDKTAKPEAKQPVKEQGKPVKQEQQNKPAQPQNQQKAQQSKSNGTYGRISDEHYRASFGSGHNFHVNQGDYNNHRFNYGGYSFGFIDPWPVGWYYTDNVYVVYDGGGYYMYDVVHPGIRISVNIL